LIIAGFDAEGHSDPLVRSWAANLRDYVSFEQHV